MLPQIDYSLFLVEILLGLGLVGLMIVDMFTPKGQKNHLIGQLSSLAVLGLLGFWLTQSSLRGATFGGLYIADSLSWFFKAFFLTTMVFVFPMTNQFFRQHNAPSNTFHLLLWTSLIGMCFLASSADFLMVFISIEILTISLYVLTAYLKSDKISVEAGMKYLVLGALSSAFLLYGMSLIYGATHSTRFDVIAQWLQSHEITPLLVLGLTLIVAAIGFKIASVPFHMWVPDVYQGAPTPVTAVLSVASKAAGFLVLIRILFGVFGALHGQLSFTLAVLAAITMTYGNVVAVCQTNIKRILGYSSIAHAGYLLMGIAIGSVDGLSGILIYLVGYLFANLIVFMTIVLASGQEKKDLITDLTSLFSQSPLLAIALTFGLVSLAGLPPLAGFFGKFNLLMGTIKANYLWLTAIASVNIVISAFYYLRMVRFTFHEHHQQRPNISLSFNHRLLLILMLAALLILGLAPQSLIDLCSQTAANMSLLAR